MTLALIFPGQGSQHPGMGRELAEAFPEARAVFGEVDEALGQSLSKIIWQGPEAELTLTENAQPALMAVSLAVMRVLERSFDFDLRKKAAFVAGHSLGEYSALAAAGAFSVAEAAKLLRIRGRAMQAAVPVGEGAMAALLGADFDAVAKLAAIAADDLVCQAANDNAPGQVVISGHKIAVERALALAKDYGARRAMLLPVSAPFHCALMAPAAEIMARALDRADMKAPAVPLIANVLARAIGEPHEIRARLVEQVTGAVRWRESIIYMQEQGVARVAEIGAGKVLSGLARRMDLDAVSLGAPAEIEAFVKTL